jgi:hypothetical protein
MSIHACTEEHLVKQPAIQFYVALGWQMTWAQVSISEYSFAERTGHA